MSFREPSMDLPSNSMPWGRSVRDRIGSIGAAFDAEILNDKSASSQMNSKLNNLSVQLRKIRAVSYISTQQFSSYSRTVPSGSLGSPHVILESPVYSLVAPTTATDALVSFAVSSSSGSLSLLKITSGGVSRVIRRPVSSHYTQEVDTRITISGTTNLIGGTTVQFGLLAIPSLEPQTVTFADPVVTAIYYSTGDQIL